MNFRSEGCESSFHTHESSQDFALVSPQLLKSISPGSNESRICLSVAPPLNHHPSSRFSCWAIPSDQTDSIAFPAPWRHLHPHIFARESTLRIACTEPVPLAEIFLTALSSEAFLLASSSGSSLSRILSKDSRIIRHGATISFDAEELTQNQNGSASHPPSSAYAFRVDHTAPVLQGVSTPRTSLILLHQPEAANETNSTSDSESLVDDDELEIDEAFLANTIPDLINEENAGSRLMRSVHGNISLTMHPLPAMQRSGDQDDFFVFVRPSGLAHLGALEGDWILIKGKNETGSRLARVFVLDDIPDSRLAAPPSFLYNVHRDFCREIEVQLAPTPFGNKIPPIPVAKSITVARIASPISTNKLFQPGFLSALKSHFDGKKRLVKQGDIIVLPLHPSPDEYVVDADTPNVTSWPSSNTVSFLISNLELEPMVGSSSLPPPSSKDVYSCAVVGELGCWVDPTVTKVVQTGIEQCRVPDAGNYFGQETVNLDTQTSIAHVQDGPVRTLSDLISATLFHGAQSMNLNPTILLTGNRGIGKFTSLNWISRHLGIHLYEINVFQVISDTPAKTEGVLRARFDQARDCAPCLVVLRHVDALSETTQSLEPGKGLPISTALKECLSDATTAWNVNGLPIVVVGTTSAPDRIPGEVDSCFKHHIKMDVPHEAQRLDILTSLVQHISLSQDVSLSQLATQTASLVAADLVGLVQQAKVKSVERARRLSGASEAALFHAVVPLEQADLDAALAQSRAAYSDSIGAPKIPNVSWDDVGGLAHVKTDILDTIQLPLEHPELFSEGLKKRSGILLYGPPGTGKTLLAKAVATSCSLNFFSVKGPELLNMYIGESEANVRRVFQRARDARPCVIFFDELDSIAPKRGNTGDSGGVMDRIVSQLLAELDGMSSASGSDVFVIGATNRPDLLDPALLRPGRFDRMLYLGVSDTIQDRSNILLALTRKFQLHPDLALEEIAKRCPPNCTGADFYALCSDAMLNAMSRKSQEIEDTIAKLNQAGPPEGTQHSYPLTPQYYLSEMATPTEIKVLVTQDDFLLSLSNLRPSVSASEMEHYRHVQSLFKSQSIGGSKDAG